MKRTGRTGIIAMVAGDRIPNLSGEERKAQTELRLNARWAPHQGYNEAYTDLRAELVLAARPHGVP